MAKRTTKKEYVSDASKLIVDYMLEIIEPKEKPSICDYADQYRFLSDEASDDTGQWDTNVVPYSREPMEAFLRKRTKVIILMWAAQCSKTEVVLNINLWIVGNDPCGVSIFLPTEDMAEKDFSVIRLEPMIRDCPVLREKFIDATRDVNTQKSRLSKTYRGGYIRLAGANKGTKTKSRPTKYAFFDEMSCEYSKSSGDVIQQILKRLQNFYGSKFVGTSTPDDKDTCPTWRLFKDSNQHVYEVPCPRCGDHIELIWEQVFYVNKDPKTAKYKCQKCRKLFDLDRHKRDMNLNGNWVSRTPEKDEEFLGYHLSALYSPWVALRDLVRKWIAAEGRADLIKEFYNMDLGLPYEEETENIDHNALYHRREVYAAEVPAGGLYLVCGVDVNDNDLSWDVTAYGKGYENWSIDYGKFIGDPAEDYVWDRVEELIERDFRHEYGFKLKIECMCIDIRGHHTDRVYQFSKKWLHRRVFAIHGKGGWGQPFIGAMRKKRKGTDRRPVPLFPIGVDSGKKLLYSRLKTKEPGVGFSHFPKSYKVGNEEFFRDCFDQNYFKELVSEKIKTTYKKGIPEKYFELPDGQRNEALDCKNYAAAACEIIRPNFEARERLYLKKKEEVESLIDEGYSEDQAAEIAVKNDYVEKEKIKEEYRPSDNWVTGGMGGFNTGGGWW